MIPKYTHNFSIDQLSANIIGRDLPPLRHVTQRFSEIHQRLSSVFLGDEYDFQVSVFTLLPLIVERWVWWRMDTKTRTGPAKIAVQLLRD